MSGCAKMAHAHGMCISHLKRFQRHGDPFAGRRDNATGTYEEKFWSFVDIGAPDECWHWNGAPSGNGYAFFYESNKHTYAHRVSWQLTNGSIPKGLVVDHRCHNEDLTCAGGKCHHRLCVNPAHLEPVTFKENLRRSRERSNVAVDE